LQAVPPSPVISGTHLYSWVKSREASRDKCLAHIYRETVCDVAEIQAQNPHSEIWCSGTTSYMTVPLKDRITGQLWTPKTDAGIAGAIWARAWMFKTKDRSLALNEGHVATPQGEVLEESSTVKYSCIRSVDTAFQSSHFQLLSLARRAVERGADVPEPLTAST
jgi:hypothetical protein